MMMPAVDGIGLIRWIRAHENHAATPIIAMTAYDEDRLKQALAAGATATAQKPDDIVKIQHIVNRLMGRGAFGVI